MQGPRADEALQGLDGYEQMVDIFAEQASLIGSVGPARRACGSCGRGLGASATLVRRMAAPKSCTGERQTVA